MSLRLRAEKKEELLMKILIYGAGVIGSLYAVYFSHAGYSVSVYARGHRLNVLKEKGLLYLEKGHMKKVRVSVLDKIKPDDCYDYIFLTVQEKHLHTALQELADNCSPTIVTMVNSIEPYEKWEYICGQGRILPAFPGAGGSIKDDVLDAALTPRLIQPTTFAEPDGQVSERVRTLEKIFRKAKIPTQVVPDMHAWQICHLAMVVPLADAYYMSAHPESAHCDPKIMRQTAQAMQDGFRKLKAMGVTISPAKMHIFRLCPVSAIAAVLPLVYRSSFGNRFMYQHAMKAQEEMDTLHRQFYSFIKDEVL